MNSLNRATKQAGRFNFILRIQKEKYFDLMEEKKAMQLNLDAHHKKQYREFSTQTKIRKQINRMVEVDLTKSIHSIEIQTIQ